jgi:hypothetical protein
MENRAKEPQKIMVDKDRFDAVLRKMINSKPLPLKDLAGTFERILPHRRAKVRKP